MKFIIILLIFFFHIANSLAETKKKVSSSASSTGTGSGQISEESSGKKIIYEYKKDEYFDFEALSVKGELLSPGDLSTKSNRRVKFQLKKYIRKNFDDFIADDLLEVY